MRSQEQFYQIVLKGHIGLDWCDCFDRVFIEYTPEGQTLLTGALPDQTALHGVLTRIRDLGLVLLVVKRIDRLKES